VLAKARWGKKTKRTFGYKDKDYITLAVNLKNKRRTAQK
jgi:hypothetical protein